MLNFEPATQIFRDDVLAGLRRQPRTLPCKYFYDERGSQLFEEICELDEYYLTRTELAIMKEHAQDMAAAIGPDVMLIEYGSGSSAKSRLLLDHLEELAAYVPVDISREHLQQNADELSRAYPDIEVLPVCADFTTEFELPSAQRIPSRVAVYFPGSTIGNFTPDAVLQMLTQIARLCGDDGSLLIGTDLQKDTGILKAAYNDSQGVTAEFNLNLLHRIARELEGDLDPEQFKHDAIYNEEDHRVEMHLVSQSKQSITIGDESFQFAEGESILTEYSHKYSVEGFADLAKKTGLKLRQCWTDSQDLFAVQHLAAGG